MKEYLIGVGIGAWLATTILYIFQKRKLDRTTQRGNRYCRQRSRQIANGNHPRERQDQIEKLEIQFFHGMDKKMNLSPQQINKLKGYLRNSINNNEQPFDSVHHLHDILEGMTQIKLIGPRSYGRISTVLQNVGINPTPIAVNIARLTDAVADVRSGVQQRDYGADIFEYDGVIIHCEDDRDAVLDFIDNITALLDVPDLSLCSLEEYQISRPRLQGLSRVYADTRYVYVYVTRNLTRDSFNRFMAEMALTEGLLDPDKRDRIVPIWTCQEHVHIPELQPFPGLKYWWYFKSDRDREQLCVKFRNHVIDGRYEMQQEADTA